MPKLDTCMYHPWKAPDGEVFCSNEVESLKQKGWVDSPTKFPWSYFALKKIKSLSIWHFYLRNWQWLWGSLLAIVLAVFFSG